MVAVSRDEFNSDVRVFHPTEEEFRSFPRVVCEIEDSGFAAAGLAKVIPPKSWKAKSGDFDLTFRIKHPIRQEVRGSNGVYTFHNKVGKAMTLADFRAEASKSIHAPPTFRGYTELERKYWYDLERKNNRVEAVYGADMMGSFFDDDVKSFNLTKLGTILDAVMGDNKIKIDGVTSPYLYFGMWKSTFAWHTEDMDLYSVNYLHHGAPKFWYVIPPMYKDKFEELAATLFPDSAKKCPAFLRHKMTMIKPEVLEKHGIPVHKMIQRPGEFIISFPLAYHAGFNTGENIAEATNFATFRWIDIGKNSRLCYCNIDTVRINMDLFVKRFQPEQYDAWIEGRRHLAANNCPPGTSNGAVTSSMTNGTDGGTAKATAAWGSTWTWPSPMERAVPIGCDPVMPDSHKNGPKWANEVKQLFVYDKFDSIRERYFNFERSKREPHCAICQCFVASSLTKRKDGPLPDTSRRILRNICYSRSPTWISDKESPEDELFQCRKCLIVVHGRCYGIGIIQKTLTAKDKTWTCIRCTSGDDFAECRLCCLRGGPLIPTQNQYWCHVICAIMIGPPVINVEPGSGFKLELPVALRKCHYCQIKRGVLVICSLNDCDRRFHVTCGAEAGCHFEFKDWPVLTSVVCTKHNLPHGDERLDLSPGSKVWAPLPYHTPDDVDPEFEPATVEKVEAQIFCVIDFDDGTFSTNAFPSDIEWCNCTPDCRGSHLSGAKVKLRWTDGELYGGTFRRAYSTDAYHVGFDRTTEEEDGTTSTLRNVCTREDVYVESDPKIPENVRKKMMESKRGVKRKSQDS